VTVSGQIGYAVVKKLDRRAVPAKHQGKLPGGRKMAQSNNLRV
jgi:hypothetical protein